MSYVPSESPAVRRAAALLLLALAAYLVSPAFTAVHVEGFSGQVQSLALFLAEQGSIQAHDLARPMVSQFIFVTRPGVVDLLAGANLLFGYTGDNGFRVLCLFSLAAIFTGSVIVARRVGGVSPWLAALACALTPGLTELGFYFNDNLVSAGFGALSLGAAVAGRRTWVAALSGVLMGMAILCRLDAVMQLPLLILLILGLQQPVAATVRGLVVMLVALVATHFVAAWGNGVSILDVLRLPKRFLELAAVRDQLPGVRPMLYFFGATTPALLLIGARVMWRQRPTEGLQAWAWVAALYVYPALLGAYVLSSVFEIRYIMPLLGPMVALHGGAGLAALARWLGGSRGGWHRGSALLLVVLFVLVAAIPPMEPAMRDGPRAIVGRLWMPLLWRRWQGTVSDNMAMLADLVQAVDSQPQAAVITTHWDDEFYLRLRLFERGYREVPPPPPCQTMSRYLRHGHEVWHVRLHSQYNIPPFDAPFAATIALAEIGNCPALASINQLWVTTFDVVRPDIAVNGIHDDMFKQPSNRSLWHLPNALGGIVGHHQDLTYRTMRVTPLSREQLARLSDQAKSVVAAEAAASGVPAPELAERYVYAFTHGRQSSVYDFVMGKMLRRPTE